MAAQPAQPIAAKATMIQRMIGAARLDVHTFEAVEADTSATKQAMFVVVIVTLATTVASLGGSLAAGTNPVLGIVFGLVWGLATWAVWALVTFLLGTTLFKTEKTHANWGELARTTGFAQAPGVLKVLAFLPVIGPLIALIASAWQLAAMVVAVRQALDYESTWRAVGVVVVGFLIVAVPLVLIAGMLGVAGMSR